MGLFLRRQHSRYVKQSYLFSYFYFNVLVHMECVIQWQFLTRAFLFFRKVFILEFPIFMTGLPRPCAWWIQLLCLIILIAMTLTLVAKSMATKLPRALLLHSEKMEQSRLPNLDPCLAAHPVLILPPEHSHLPNPLPPQAARPVRSPPASFTMTMTIIMTMTMVHSFKEFGIGSRISFVENEPAAV